MDEPLIIGIRYAENFKAPFMGMEMLSLEAGIGLFGIRSIIGLN